MNTSFNYKQIAKITGILLLGLFLGWIFFGGSVADQPESMDEHVAQAHTDAQGNIIYTCSMHPSVRQNEPGNCPICGMELIPVSDGTSANEENPYELTMTPAAMRLAEVQTTEISRGTATKTVRMPGKITVDERRVKSLPAHFPGRVEELYANFTGEYIIKGSPVASVYSPELITAQKELLEAAKHKEQNPALYRAARTKLRNWKISESQIDEIESSGEVKTEFDIYTHLGGYVIEKNIDVGDHITMGSVMYKIADLSHLWVMFQAYENDLAGLEKGDTVEFTVGAYPGETFNARITYIDPVLNSMKRTVSVRAEVANPNNRLKPGMLAEGMVSSTLDKGTDQLLVPKSAVLWTGERSVAYVKKPNTEQPTFEFREVVLGQRVGDQYVVKSGLEAGEEVVTNGNFKIDSAAQLAGKASMMNQDPDGSMPAGHDHGSMEMKSSVPDTAEHQHSEHLSSLLNHYMTMKNSLAGDNFEEAKQAMRKLAQEVTQSDAMNNHPEHSEMHSQHHAAMVNAIKVGSEAANLNQMRRAFASISENLVKAVENQGYSEDDLYLQYCPMAQDGNGAYWVSNQKTISNPYMGQKMPSCGETKKSLDKDSG